MCFCHSAFCCKILKQFFFSNSFLYLSLFKSGDSIQDLTGLSEGIYNANLNLSSNASTAISYPIILTSTSNSILGDLNGDSLINVVDIVQLVNIALGLSPEITAADINEDGIINVLDVIQLVNIVLDN